MTKPTAVQDPTQEIFNSPLPSSDEEPNSFDLFDQYPFDRYEMDFEPMEID